MTRPSASAALACAILLAGGCRSSEASLEIGFGDDAGTCAQVTDLSCVNFLRFSVDDGSGFTTQCVKVTEQLTSLCDVAELGSGQELFRIDPDKQVQFKVEGLRVYPATSCEAEGCQRRILFTGVTQTFRMGDRAGQSIPLVVTVNEPCGGREEYFPLPGGMTCDDICGHGSTVCQIEDGCLCKAL